MILTTSRFRLKDSTSRNRLRRLGWACNDVWNYGHEHTACQWAFRPKIPNGLEVDDKVLTHRKSIKEPSDYPFLKAIG